jgi:hypothetical protein
MDSRLEGLRQALESAVEGVSSERLHSHPQGKWCAAEVLEHLYLSYTGTINGFQRVLEAGKPLGTRPSLKQRCESFVVFGLHHLPTGREAPAVARPKGLPLEKVKNELGEKMAEMDAIISECEARFGRRIRVLDHPILGPLTAPQWRKLHWLHGLHHRKQLLRMREGMPAN